MVGHDGPVDFWGELSRHEKLLLGLLKGHGGLDEFVLLREDFAFGSLRPLDGGHSNFEGFEFFAQSGEFFGRLCRIPAFLHRSEDRGHLGKNAGLFFKNIGSFVPLTGAE